MVSRYGNNLRFYPKGTRATSASFIAVSPAPRARAESLRKESTSLKKRKPFFCVRGNIRKLLFSWESPAKNVTSWTAVTRPAENNDDHAATRTSCSSKQPSQEPAAKVLRAHPLLCSLASRKPAATLNGKTQAHLLVAWEEAEALPGGIADTARQSKPMSPLCPQGKSDGPGAEGSITRVPVRYPAQ